MRKKVRTDKQVKTIFWVGFAICLLVTLLFRRHVSEVFLVAVIWYAYWYMTVKRPHELRKLLEEEARQEAEWQAEQERLRLAQEAEAEGEAPEAEDEPEDGEAPDCEEENEDN